MIRWYKVEFGRYHRQGFGYVRCEGWDNYYWHYIQYATSSGTVYRLGIRGKRSE